MNSRCIWIPIALAAASCQSAQLQTAEPVPVKQFEYAAVKTPQLLELWLLENCALPADDKLVAVLRARRAEVTPQLRRALKAGPPDSLVAQAEAAARARFTMRRKALEEPDRLGLSDDDLKRAMQRSEAKFVARAKESLDTGYRSQALLGLVAVLGSDADADVDAVAADEKSSARTTALLLQKKR